jgi:hypothetical protein
MKYLKTFESRFKDLDKQEIEDNIGGILVDLSDDNLIVAIDWLNGESGLEIHVQDSGNKIGNKKEFYISEDYIDRFLTAVDYLKKQWGDVEVKYEFYNENSNLSASTGVLFPKKREEIVDSTNLNYLGDLKKVTEFQITVQKLDSTPKKIDERLGIIQDMEQQVESYMKTIRERPISKVFKLLYQCDLGNYSFKLVIDPNIEEEGYFTGSGNFIGDMEIYLKDRENESTLLHEVKHLDYYLRKKGKTTSIYNKARRTISDIGNPKFVNKRLLIILEHLFYIFDENEFQSKYQSFYKDFDLFLSKQNVELNTTNIRELFFSEEWHNQFVSFNFYTTSKEFKFNYFFNEDELRAVFGYIILENNKRRVFQNPYLDFLSYLTNDIKKNIKMRFKIFDNKQKEEIDRIINFFEKDINKRIAKYKKRMSRIVTLACEKYVK